MRKGHLRLILALCVFEYLLSACNTLKRYEQYDGITYIAPPGNPPVDRLIWSPSDSSKILITASGLGQGRAQIYILDIITKKKDILVETEYGNVLGSTWSPDGKYVAIAIYPGTKGYDPGLWIWDVNETHREIFGEPAYAAWSPDGMTMATFTITPGRAPEIGLHLIDINTKKDGKIYTNRQALMFSGPSWSPDGQHLAFSIGNKETSNIYILDIERHQINQITQSKENVNNDFPVWSPVGNVIAYQRSFTVGGRVASSLHLVSPDGSCDVEIPFLDFVLSPTWSPDGKKLVFIGPDGVYILDLDTFMKKYIESSPCLQP